jgi:hypothetical protein
VVLGGTPDRTVVVPLEGAAAVSALLESRGALVREVQRATGTRVRVDVAARTAAVVGQPLNVHIARGALRPLPPSPPVPAQGDGA